MKKFTLILVALIMTTMVFAQGANTKVAFKPIPSLKTEKVKAVTSLPTRTSAQPVKKAPRRAEVVSELVSLPEGVEAETWYIAGGGFYLWNGSDWTHATSYYAISVAFNGNDVYIQGLAYFFKSAWIKGTNVDGTVTFPITFVGADNYGDEYLVGSNDGETVCDLEFTYDSDAETLTLTTPYIFENGSSNELGYYGYGSDIVLSKNAPEGPTLVELPEEAEVAPYVMTYTDSKGNPASTPVNVAVVGDNVYVQGFSSYLPEAWVVGTKEGNTVTFATDQYFGVYSGYESYAFYTGDAVFTYNAENGTYSAEGTMFNVLGGQYYDGYYTNPVITPVVEKAGTPAAPEITAFANSDYGYVVGFNIPLVDTEGNALVAGKLSYIIYTDTEGEIAPLTFTPTTHTRLTEELTEIPYGFTENYDFYTGTIYLNDLYSAAWNKIGIKSIYRGGGEENETEIQWYDIKPYSNAAYTFDFNSMDVATSDGRTSTDGDITADYTIEGENITLTISPKTSATTENRFWATNNGPQLRVYSGTLTFAAPDGYVITGIQFNAGKWNDGNTADSGEFDGMAWTGEAQNVVVSIAGNTQINSIVVTVKKLTLEAVEITVPEDLVTEAYYFTGHDTYYDEDVTKTVNVGFYGDDEVYIQGLSEYVTEGWVKGRLNGTTVTIPETYLGVYQSFFGDYEMVFAGATFQYDEENSTFTAPDGFVSYLFEDAESLWDEFENVVLTKIVERAAVPATPEITRYVVSETYGPYFYFNIPLVDVDGNAMIPEKLSYKLYIDQLGEVSQYTLLADNFENLDEDMVEIPYGFTDSWDIYTAQIYLNPTADVNINRLGIQSIYRGLDEENASEIAWFEVAPYITIDSKGLATLCYERPLTVFGESGSVYAAVLDIPGERLVLNEVEAVPAGEGVIVAGEPGTVVNFAAANNSYNNFTLAGQNDLEGTLVDIEDYDSGILALGVNRSNEVGFYTFTGDVFPAGKAYLAPVALSKLSLVFGEGEATGINTVVAPVKSDDRVFNLNGQRVNRAQKGVYIVNGKKVVIK